MSLNNMLPEWLSRPFFTLLPIFWAFQLSRDLFNGDTTAL